MMRSAAVAALLVLAACSAHAAKAVSGNINVLVDAVLTDANRAMPANFPLVVKNDTKLNLQNCTLIGLENGIHRKGNATLGFANSTISASVELYVSRVGANCLWSHAPGLDGTMEATTKMPQFVISVDGVINVNGPSNLKADFKILNLGKLDVELTGLSVLDPIIEKLAESIANGPLRKLIEKVIVYELPSIIQSQLDHF